MSLSSRSIAPLEVPKSSQPPLMPMELLALTFTYLDLNATATVVPLVCSHFRTSAHASLLYFFKTVFPELYKKISNKDYKKIMGDIDWRKEYIYAHQQYCNATHAQFADWVAVRTGNIAEIKRILASKNAMKCITHCDLQGNNIFDYLARLEPAAERKAIFLQLFDALINDLFTTPIENELLDIEKKYADVPNWKRLFQASPDLNAYLLLVVACNQVRVLKIYLASGKFIPGDQRFELLSLALKYNNEDIFFAIFNGDNLFKLLDHLITKQNRINLSESFAQRLFAHIMSSCLKSDKKNRNMMHWAILLRQEEYIRKALQGKESNINKKLIYAMQSGLSPLHYVCFHDISFYDFLRGLKVSPSQLDYATRTKHEKTELIEYAAKCGNLLLLQRLIRRNELKNASIPTTVMDAAIRKGHLDCVRLLVKNGQRLTVEHAMVAMKFRHLHILEYLGHHDKFKRLLTHPDVKIGAFELKRLPIIKFILPYIDAKETLGTSGKNVLHFIAATNHDLSGDIALLHSKQADLNALDNNHMCPLHHAITKLEVETGKNPSAVKNITKNIIAFLQAGADFYNVKDANNESAYDYLLQKNIDLETIGAITAEIHKLNSQRTSPKPT